MRDSRSSKSSLHAVRHLCEMAHRPNRRSFETVMGHDWRPFPRVWSLLEEHGDGATPELIRDAARSIVARFLDDCDGLHPGTPENPSPVEVLRDHVLRGEKWELIVAKRAEAGLSPVSERTLKNRQREAFELLIVWAREPQAEDGPGSRARITRRSMASKLPPRHPGRRVPARGVAVLGLLAVLLVVFGLRAPEDPAEKVATGTIGATFQFPADSTRFARSFPEFRIPDLESFVSTAVIVPLRGSAELGVVLGTSKPGPEPGTLAMYALDSGDLVWKRRWVPPADQVMTHDLPPAAAAEVFSVSRLIYGGPYGNLGERVAAVFVQRFSPTFVAFFDIASGEVEATYAHPGHCHASNLVANVLGDSTPELVLGGCDNTRNRPVLVVLDPRMGPGAASTVRWQKPRGYEDALLRILLPDVTEVTDSLGVKRLGVDRIEWNANTRQATLAVGMAGVNAYYAVLDSGLTIGANPYAVGDNEELLMRALGIDIPRRLHEMRDSTRVIRGSPRRSRGTSSIVSRRRPGA